MQVEHLVEVQREFGDHLTIVGLTKAADAKAQAYADKHGATYSVRGDAANAFGEYGVSWVPSVKLIAPTGEILYEDRFSKVEPSSTQLKIVLRRRLPKS